MMPNFFFFSFQDDLTIQYVKVTVKFDNLREGKARFSFKIWLSKKTTGKPPELYLFLSNRERATRLERIDENYNQYLKEEAFRQAAGIEDTTIGKEQKNYLLRKITKFDEDRNLVGKTILHPMRINVERVRPNVLPKEVIKCVMNNDVLLKINPVIGKEAGQTEMPSPDESLIEFQFRLILGDFLEQEALDSWKSSSEPWSVNIDIHKERNFKDIHEAFGDYLRYPMYLDLWINIPHGHLFVASSPVYKNAIKLKKEDIGYKTYEKEEGITRRIYEQFETETGDYSVKIANSDGEPREFSIVCTSPFLPGETPHELRKDLEEFNTVKERFVKWEDMVSPLVILLAIISVLFSFPQYQGNISDDFFELIIEAAIFGLVLWSISLALDKLGNIIGKKIAIGKIDLLLIILLLSLIVLRLAI